MTRQIQPVRFRRVAAIAKRDLMYELRGRRGLMLPLIATILLLPTATVKVHYDPLADREITRVTGFAPSSVTDLDSVEFVRRRAWLRFRPDDDGTMLVEGSAIPLDIRDALEGDAKRKERPSLELVDLSTTPKVPSRSIFFAMISASILTGAIAESLPGERSRKTLKTLLSASITRFELILGKWLAWASFGAGSALAAALVALLLGRSEAGMWLLPLPTVAMATVALGLFLVHRSEDVVSGATVSLRILPAVLTCSGLVAWLIGNERPLLGAAVPIGGALVAAGNTWEGVTPPLIATASSLGLTAGLLLYTAGHLEQLLPLEQPLRKGLLAALVTFAITAFCWWTPVVGPLLWASGGNPQLTRDLATQPGVTAGVLGLALFAALQFGRSTDPEQEFGLRMPDLPWWFWGMGAGAVFALCAPAAALMPSPEAPFYAHASARMAAAINPTWCGITVFRVCVVSQELVFRGWLQTRVGPVLSAVVFALVIHPLNPIRILPIAFLLAGLRAKSGSVIPSWIARVVWVWLSTRMVPIEPLLALAISFVTPALFWKFVHRKTQ